MGFDRYCPGKLILSLQLLQTLRYQAKGFEGQGRLSQVVQSAIKSSHISSTQKNSLQSSPIVKSQNPNPAILIFTLINGTLGRKIITQVTKFRPNRVPLLQTSIVFLVWRQLNLHRGLNYSVCICITTALRRRTPLLSLTAAFVAKKGRKLLSRNFSLPNVETLSH